MDKQKFTTIKQIFTAQAVAAGGTATSSAVDITMCGGDCTLYLEITGDGTLTASYSITLDESDYVTPDGVSYIKAGLTKTSGTSGKIAIAFQPKAGSQLKITLTETGVASTNTVTGYLAVR